MGDSQLSSDSLPCMIVVGRQRSGAGRIDSPAPRLDYLRVAEQLGATVAYWDPPPSALSGPRAWRVVRSFGGNVTMARRMLDRLPAGALVYTTGETWGLPVGLVAHAMRAKVRHVMYVHRVFSRRWLNALRRLRPYLRVDGWICVTRHQAGLLQAALGPDARVTATSQGVDTQFWDLAKAKPYNGELYILSVGTEMRDYPLLFEAVKGLDVRVTVKASSAWMREARHELGTPPPNVQVLTKRLSYVEMRDLYAGAALVVVPLLDTPQAAGITTVLEAMAMGKCVVVTESQGLPDIVVGGQTALVAGANATELRSALLRALENNPVREALAERGRTAACAQCAIEEHARAVLTAMIAAQPGL